MKKTRTTSRRSETRKGEAKSIPTLARLSFDVPVERMAGFATDYEAKIVPILKKHDLTESAERGRATPAHIFSRLFEVKTLSEVVEKREALQKDPAWQEALRNLGRTFGTGDPIQHHFDLYTAPAGPGKVVSAGPGKGHWRIYDGADGLANIWVRLVFQDREGYIWFGTESGVSRYDGRTFTTFTTQDGLANNLVNSIFQDREGNLWFGTRCGVSRYDGKSFVTFTTRDGLANDEVASITQDWEGVLWFGTGSFREEGGGVSRYDGAAWTTFTVKDGLAGNTVLSTTQDREGYLWFGTRGGGVSRYDREGRRPPDDSQNRSPCPNPGEPSGRGTWTTFTVKDGLAGNSVSSIFQDREGVLWFGTGSFWDEGGGVSRYDGATWTTFTVKDGLASNYVSSILQDREGVLWFGTLAFTIQHGGVSRYDPSASSGQAWTTFTVKDGLAGNGVLSILQDREGYLWFSSPGVGVSRYDGQVFTTFTVEDGLGHNWVRSILQDREGNLWFSTQGGGVSRYDGKIFTTFTTEDGLASNGVRSILQDREGNLWFGTGRGGVNRYDRAGRRRLNDSQDRSLPLKPSESSGMGTFTTFTTEDGLAGKGVWPIFQDREGDLWFGTIGGGVSRYDGKIFTTFTTKDGLAHNEVRSIFQDREGNLWFSTYGGGVSRYDPSTSSGGAGQKFTSFTTEDGLALNVVSSGFQDREGNLWFGTWGEGVSRYDGKTWRTFSTEDGLAHNVVISIFQDRDDVLWFGTNSGVSRYDGQVFQTMTQQDGLASNGVYTIFQDQDGILWFGTSNGLTRYCPPAPSPPPVFIDAVVGDRRYEGIAEVEVPSVVRLTAFEFHGRSLKTRPEQMVYRYRLKGHEEAWRNTRERRVEYEDLPVGEYTFEVVAVDRDLVYSKESATVRITVVRDTRDEQIDELERRVQERTQALQDANGALSSANRELFTLNRDLQQTLKEKERAQRLLIQAERMAAVGELVAGSAHELNNPLGATSSLVQSIGEMLKEDTPEELMEDRALMTENVRIALKDLNRAKEIVANLLSLSDRTRDYTEAVRVNIVADDALRLLRGTYDREKVRVVKEYGEDLPTVTGNFADLGQMGMHLVRNAVEAMKGEGTITLRTAFEGGQVVFECRDTGKGIPAEIRGEIFKPFFKTKPPAEGTGLGLYICHQIVEKHGGAIEVESALGKGTTFRVKLPPTR